MKPARTVLLDPPWPEYGGGGRGAQNHYPLIRADSMAPVILLSGVWNIARDAHMYCWATSNYLPNALELMRQLDFRYVTNLCWVKDKSGLGQYFRGRHEICLFGVRGSGYAVRTDRRDISSVLDVPESLAVGAPRGAHSAKPTEFYELIEARSEGPYLEIFARHERPGWVTWGNQVPTPDVDERQEVLFDAEGG